MDCTQKHLASNNVKALKITAIIGVILFVAYQIFRTLVPPSFSIESVDWITNGYSYEYDGKKYSGFITDTSTQIDTRYWNLIITNSKEANLIEFKIYKRGKLVDTIGSIDYVNKVKKG